MPTAQPSHPPHPQPVNFQTAYRTGALADFFALPEGDLTAALELPRTQDRAALAAALRPHAERLGAPRAALANIDRLARPGSLAVVTGQQTGLLLGPSYTLAKAATAIVLARRLDTPERPVVPLFWLATQDHDAAEIDHTYLLDGSGCLRRVAVGLPEGIAAGRIRADGAHLDTVRAAVAKLSPRSRFEDEVIDLLRDALGRSESFADWFGATLYRLLGEHGLVLVDPLEPAVAKGFSHVLAREIEEPSVTPRAVNEAGERLKLLGYEPQLGRAADATNLFVELPGDESGPRRTLLKRSGKGFVAEGREFSTSQLLEMLAADPTSITPAAGLRPITQDALLPTAVFVLGPGELRYVAQLREVYEFHSVAMPLAWLRASMTLLEPVSARLLKALGLTAAEFRRDPEGIQSRVLLERHGHASAFSKATQAIESSYLELLAAVDGIDPTLDGTVTRARRHLDISLEKLRAKSAAALSRKDAKTRQQFQRLESHLLPLGAPSERVLSPFSHALKFGVQPVVDRFMAMEPSGEQELPL